MSETTEHPAAEPEPAGAPPEAPETPAEEQQPTEREREEERSRAAKRVSFALARATRAERENAELAARVAALEQNTRAAQQYQAPADPAVQQAINARAQELAREQQAEEVKARFQAAGAAAYPDWQQRCQDLMAMGAIPISHTIAQLPDGHRIAAALRDAPEELEEILSHHGESARNVALGKFVAKLAATPTRAISRAPKPPPPVSGRVNPVYDPYQEQDPSRLAEIWAREEMAKRRRG